MDRSSLVLWKWPDDSDSFLFKQAEKILEWAEERMVNGTFPREDYRELLELTVVYLGGTVKRKTLAGVVETEFYMRFPGKKE